MESKLCEKEFGSMLDRVVSVRSMERVRGRSVLGKVKVESFVCGAVIVWTTCSFSFFSFPNKFLL